MQLSPLCHSSSTLLSLSCSRPPPSLFLSPSSPSLLSPVAPRPSLNRLLLPTLPPSCPLPRLQILVARPYLERIDMAPASDVRSVHGG